MRSLLRGLNTMKKYYENIRILWTYQDEYCEDERKTTTIVK